MALPNFVPAFQSDQQRVIRNYEYFDIEPINGAIGAELEGIDLSKDLNDLQVKEIRTALLDHLVLVFRSQSLSPSQLSEFGKRFGELHINPFVSGVEGVQEVIEIRSEENNEKRFTGLWHSDISWEAKPSMGSLLYGVEIPEYGGDTLFANMHLAYETLTEGYKNALESLNAEHRVDNHGISTVDNNDQPKPVNHPVIRTHPETGRKALFVNEYFTQRFKGMTEKESEPMLRYLFSHATRPDFSCRIRWQKGMLVFWDNRNTIHYATNDYAGHKRLMHRITINGDKPF